MTESERVDYVELIRTSKSELQAEFNEKNRALHSRIKDTASRIENATDKIIAVGNNISSIRAEMKAELSHRPDDGDVIKLVNETVEKSVAKQALICRGEASGVIMTEGREKRNTAEPVAAQTVLATIIGNKVLQFVTSGSIFVGVWKLAEYLISLKLATG